MANLAANGPVMARVAAAERIDGLRWNLILKNQTVVKLPADDPQTALATLASLQTSMALLDRPVQSIDLRLPGKMIVHPYPTPAPTPQESRG
jgi:cell division protein FtsQ